MSTLGNLRIRRKVIKPSPGGVRQLGYYNSNIPDVNGHPTANWAPNKLFVQSFNYDAEFVEGKYTEDVLHSGPPYLEGGPFKSLRLVYSDPYNGVFGNGTYYRSDGLQRYVGGFSPPSDATWTTMPGMGPLNVGLIGANSAFPSMSDWGDKAYARAKPKIEKASLFVFLAELRDLSRMLKTTSRAFHDIWKLSGGNQASKVMRPKNVADHFLNHQFGWTPFLSDVRRFVDVFQNTARLKSQMTSRNGRWIRRRVTLKDDSVYELLNQGLGKPISPSMVPEYFNTPPSWTLSQTVKTKINAVGRFKYYRPEFDANLPDYSSVWNSAKRQLDLYGLRISPSNVYRAIPWTWAADWISNLGTHVDYLTDIAMDSVACQYFYVMQHRITERKLNIRLPFYTGLKILEYSRIVETKERQVGAGPYGFSLSWDNLTPRQGAIAAALAITRQRPPGRP